MLKSNSIHYKIKNLNITSDRKDVCIFSKPFSNSSYYIIKAKTHLGTNIYLGYYNGTVTMETNYKSAYKFNTKQKGIAMIYNQVANDFKNSIVEDTIRLVEITADAFITAYYKIVA